MGIYQHFSSTAMISFFRPIGKADTGFCRPIGKADTGFYRPISPVGLNTGSAFSPFCAPSASASPRGRRERTVVRPLALGLASLNSHQTDENASLGRPISLCSIRALGSAYFAIAQYGYARALFRPLGSIRARLASPPAYRPPPLHKWQWGMDIYLRQM